jgi:mono/diheme cytochrome c family protein
MKGGFTWTSCVLSLTVALGCGGDRRSGALPATDSGQTSAPDRTAAAPIDSTAAAAADTGHAAARPDSASKAQDTVSAAASPKPSVKPALKPKGLKPRAAKPAAPASAATPTKPADTSRISAVPESTGAAPIQTSDASAPLRDEYHRAPLDTVSQDVYQGWKQFNLNCARCHGEDVQGTTIAPHLIVSLRPDGPINTKELFVQTVCAGRPAKGMPAWCALGLDMDKINQIYSYVKGRSDSKIHPGRPAVKSGG